MSKKETLENLFKDLAEALQDASHMYFMGENEEAKHQMEVADKLMEAIRLANGDNTWQCKEAHCAFKHNDRGDCR